MNNSIGLICRQILVMGICTVFFSCVYAQSDTYRLPDPQIKAGIAKVSGKFLNLPPDIKSVTIYCENPVTAEQNFIETSIKDDGSFHFEVPVECSVFYGAIAPKGYYGAFVVLSTDKETEIELKIDSTPWVKVVKNSMRNLLLKDEISYCDYDNIFDAYCTYSPKSGKPLYEMTLQEFAQHEIETMNKRIEHALEGKKLSNAGRTFVVNNFKIHHLDFKFFSYKEVMKRLFRIINGKEKADSFSPQEPDRTYYNFLRSFNLNDPQYIYCIYYPKVVQCILSAEALSIPPIADTPVDEWLSGVKATLADLVGFESGQFYDMLAANAYAKQFNEKQIPLSDKQKENIRKYYGNDGEIAKILLRRNDKIVEMAAEKMASVINETPDVPKEKIMDTIVSKYKGKVVVVDLWATWCGPCMQAIKQIKDVKHELKGKDVVYVYITNGSSPKKLWNEVIATINGEHYYITGEKWEYLMDSFGFEGIPSYVIYDTKGELKHKFTGYPSNADMKKMIEESTDQVIRGKSQ